MATSMMQKVPEISLGNPALSNQTSLKFIKELTAVAISTIVFCRNMFDSKDFKKKTLYGVDVWVVKGVNDSNNGPDLLSKWLKGAFHAMDRKYLKSLTLEIKKEELLFETYTFRYSYDENSQCTLESTSGDCVGSSQVPLKNMSEVKKIMRNILTMTSSADDLPDVFVTSMKIEYYDNTPPDYEPPGFQSLITESKFPVCCEQHTWRMGDINTPFHKLKVSTSQMMQKPKVDTDSGKSNEVCEGSQQSDAADVFCQALDLCLKAKSVSVQKLMQELCLNGESSVLMMRRLARENALHHSTQPFSIEKPEICYEVNTLHIKNQLVGKYLSSKCDLQVEQEPVAEVNSKKRKMSDSKEQASSKRR